MITYPPKCVMYMADMPTSNNTLTATFADDTQILATHKDHAIASANLQAAANEFNNWAKRWKIKTNNTKSIRIDFALHLHPLRHTTLDDAELFISAQSCKVPRSPSGWEAHLENAHQEETGGGQTQIPLSILATPLKKQTQAVIPFCYQTNLDICSAAPVWANIEILQRSQNLILQKMGCTLVHLERLSAPRPQSWNCKADHRKACNFIQEASTPPKHTGHPTPQGSPSLQIKKGRRLHICLICIIAKTNQRIPIDLFV